MVGEMSSCEQPPPDTMLAPSRSDSSPVKREYGVGGSPAPRSNTGTVTPRGRGRGRGVAPFGNTGRPTSTSKLGPDTPLSELLHRERPLLRPIVFVRSVYTPTLFGEAEDILQASVENTGESSLVVLLMQFQVRRMIFRG